MARESRLKFGKYIKQREALFGGQTLVAGVSGGADSVCLLALLSEYAATYNYKITVVHLNHCIRGAEADADEDYVKDMCRSLNEKGVDIFFHAYREDIRALAREKGMSVEEAGRKRRYELFAEVCGEYGSRALFVAHNASDRAETVLFNLARGSSLDGLCGIRDEAELPGTDICIYRPLLSFDRTEIEAFLVEKGIAWRTDSTNLSGEYTRNRIRLGIMPELRKINAAADRHINESAKDLQEISDYLEEEAGKQYLCRCAGGVMSLDGFEEIPAPVRKRICHRFICEAAGRKKDIERSHILALCDLAGGESGGSVDLPYGLRAEKEYDKIRIFKVDKDKNDRSSGGAYGEEEKAIKISLTALAEGKFLPASAPVLTENYSLYAKVLKKEFVDDFKGNGERVFFDLDKVLECGDEAVFRKAKEGDWFCPFTDGRKKDLNRFFIDNKLPRREREETIVFAVGSHVLWILGHRNDESFRVDDNSSRILEAGRKENIWKA